MTSHKNCNNNLSLLHKRQVDLKNKISVWRHRLFNSTLVCSVDLLLIISVIYYTTRGSETEPSVRVWWIGSHFTVCLRPYHGILQGLCACRYYGCYNALKALILVHHIMLLQSTLCGYSLAIPFSTTKYRFIWNRFKDSFWPLKRSGQWPVFRAHLISENMSTT